MKLVAKFSIVLGATLALVFALAGYIWVGATQTEVERSVEHDHDVIGRVLAAGIAEVWIDTKTDPQRADREIDALLDRSSQAVGNTRFEWHLGEQTPAEIQRIEGTEFVSR